MKFNKESAGTTHPHAQPHAQAHGLSSSGHSILCGIEFTMKLILFIHFCLSSFSSNYFIFPRPFYFWNKNHSFSGWECSSVGRALA